MESDSRSRWQGKGVLEELMRERIRSTIETIVEEELDEALGAARSQRVGANRAGYRHGKRRRTLTTSLGPTTIAMPRARIESDDGRRREWRSQIIPRYQRRTERVDEAILGVYLSGTNTRRLRGALAPLLRGAPLSKDAASRSGELSHNSYPLEGGCRRMTPWRAIAGVGGRGKAFLRS